MQYYYHEQLTDLDESGFGSVYMTSPATYTPPHWHRPIELFCFLSGSASIRIDGQRLPLQPGDLYLFNSYAIHESWFSGDASYLCVHILPARMCRYVSDFDRLSFSLPAPGDAAEPGQAAALAQLRAAMRELLLLETEKPLGHLLRRQALFYTIALLLVRHFSKIAAPGDDLRRHRENIRLEPLLVDMDLRHDEELPLDEAAAAMGFSREYFCRFFKRNMGVSYLQYLNQLRTAAVCRELETSDDPIGEIAQRHGLHNMKLFHALFRQIYGCTPTEKRKQMGKGQNGLGEKGSR